MGNYMFFNINTIPTLQMG